MSFFPNYTKIKVDSYDSLSIEQTKVTSVILYS